MAIAVETGDHVLLDTQAFLWWVGGEKPLPATARNLVADENTTVLFSLASVWEMSIKSRLGKLALPEPAALFVQKQCRLNRFQLVPISMEAIGSVETLPHIHGDPFDRLLAAECLQLGVPIISSDAVFGKYKVRRIWK